MNRSQSCAFLLALFLGAGPAAAWKKYNYPARVVTSAGHWFDAEDNSSGRVAIVDAPTQPAVQGSEGMNFWR
jgi:hypothetical protein